MAYGIDGIPNDVAESAEAVAKTYELTDNQLLAHMIYHDYEGDPRAYLKAFREKGEVGVPIAQAVLSAFHKHYRMAPKQ